MNYYSREDTLERADLKYDASKMRIMCLTAYKPGKNYLLATDWLWPLPIVVQPLVQKEIWQESKNWLDLFSLLCPH